MTKFGLVWAILFALLAVPAAAEDRRAGYYYRPPATIET